MLRYFNTMSDIPAVKQPVFPGKKALLPGLCFPNPCNFPSLHFILLPYIAELFFHILR